MHEVAYTFHFQPSELERMPIGKLLKWHDGAARIQKAVAGA